jgi:hypothetical protein
METRLDIRRASDQHLAFSRIFDPLMRRPPRDAGPPPTERTLWVLVRAGRHARAVARARTYGVELVVFVNEELHWSQLFGANVNALAATAESKRRAWEALGWVEPLDAG